MNPIEDRQQYVERLERFVEQQDLHHQIAFDKSSSISDRSNALNRFEGHLNEDDVGELKNIIQDKGVDIELRISAINALSIEVSESEALQDTLLFLLGDVTEPPTVRSAALNLLQQSNFVGALNLKRPQYLYILRAIINDKDKALRHTAIQILAYENDEYVQRRLLDSIERRSNKLIGISSAIQLLSSDIHADHYTTLEGIVNDPPSRSARKEAVRALAADSASKELLRTIMENKEEHREIRQMAAAAFNAVAPIEFEEYAKTAVLDEGEYEDFRALSITALSLLTDPKSSIEDTDFNNQVKNLQAANTSKLLRNAINSYLKDR